MEDRHTSNSITTWAPNVFTHPKLKLTWEMLGTAGYTYVPHTGNRLFSVQVIQHWTNNFHSEWYGKWEVIIGLEYWSRDNNRLFTSRVNAMVVAEKLIAKKCHRVISQILEMEAVTVEDAVKYRFICEAELYLRPSSVGWVVEGKDENVNGEGATIDEAVSNAMKGVVNT